MKENATKRMEPCVMSHETLCHADIGVVVALHERNALRTGNTAVLPFTDFVYLRWLTVGGSLLGMRIIVIGSRITHTDDPIIGYTYDPHAHHWTKKRYAVPLLLYDRYFPPSLDDRASVPSRRIVHPFSAIRAKPTHPAPLRWLCNPVPDKHTVYQLLKNDDEIPSWLPHTQPYHGIKTFETMLDAHRALILKPVRGMQGHGILRLERLSHHGTDFPTYTLSGGTRRSAPQAIPTRWHRVQDVARHVQSLYRNKSFLVQQALPLNTEDDRPADVRVLIQKNGRGAWHMTGAVARIGSVGALTSNLHQGGIAQEASVFLKRHCPHVSSDVLCATLAMRSQRIATRLEQQIGPLLELGLDFGVSRHGDVWLLEANGKPGRHAFVHTFPLAKTREAFTLPLHYAQYTLNRQHKGGAFDARDV